MRSLRGLNFTKCGFWICLNAVLAKIVTCCQPTQHNKQVLQIGYIGMAGREIKVLRRELDLLILTGRAPDSFKIDGGMRDGTLRGEVQRL